MLKADLVRANIIHNSDVLKQISQAVGFELTAFEYGDVILLRTEIAVERFPDFVLAMRFKPNTDELREISIDYYMANDVLVTISVASTDYDRRAGMALAYCNLYIEIRM